MSPSPVPPFPVRAAAHLHFIYPMPVHQCANVRPARVRRVVARTNQMPLRCCAVVAKRRGDEVTQGRANLAVLSLRASYIMTSATEGQAVLTRKAINAGLLQSSRCAQMCAAALRIAYTVEISPNCPLTANPCLCPAPRNSIREISPVQPRADRWPRWV